MEFKQPQGGQYNNNIERSNYPKPWQPFHHDHYAYRYPGGCPQYQKRGGDYKIPIIDFANACVEPLAMVVESVAAPVASGAMLRRFVDPHLANGTKHIKMIYIGLF